MLGRLWPLALATFAVGTDGFVIAGLLPRIADGLDVGVAAAGQLVTVFAITFAISAPISGALTGAIDRRTALVGALAVFVAGNVFTAVGTTFAVVLGARVVTALGAGVINSAASSTAAALVPAERRGRALAVVMGGLSGASVLGLPLGILIGSADWRVTLWAVAGLGVVAAVGVVLRLPSVRLPATTLAGRLAPLRDRAVLGIVATSTLAMVACYTVFTYLSVALGGVTHGSAGLLAVVLLVSGAATVTGTLLAGRFTDQYPARRVLLVALVGLGVMLLLAPLAVRTLPGALAWAVFWGAAVGVPVVPQQHRLIARAPGSAPVVLGLNSAAMYAGIGVGGALGGLAQHWMSADLLGLPAAVVAACAVGLAALPLDRAAAYHLDGEPGRLSA